MSLSFTLRKNPQTPKTPQQRRSVLVTGAAGNIGSYFARHSSGRYKLRLMVRGDEPGIDALSAHGQLVSAHLHDLPRLKELCTGMDTVLHLAASPSPSSTWEELLPNNIVGTYNIMVAARSAGCRRVIFASSIHAVSGYPADVQVKGTDPVNPGDLYGVTKCFGESLGRYMAEQERLSVIALRIGAFQPLDHARLDEGVSMMDMFISHQDLNQLIEKCIDDEKLQWAVLQALSNNRFKRLDISDARELVGFDPQDDSTELNPRLRELHLNQTVQAGNVSDEGQESGIREDVSPDPLKSKENDQDRS